MKDNLMWCNECKQAVEVKTVYETQCEEPNGVETFNICTLCGGGDLDLITQCKQCQRDMPDNGEAYCDACKKAGHMELSKLVYNSGFQKELMFDLMQEMLEG